MTEKSLWGGRFASGPSAELTAFSRSAPAYFQLATYDLAGSVAHAGELRRANVLSDEEYDSMIGTLRAIGDDFITDAIAPQPQDEDVHTFLERELIERMGETGGKIRAGRSRNDQTANDLRLYLRDHARILADLLAALAQELVARAEEFAELPCPGFTHLQIAQPIVFGHQLLAHVQPIIRNLRRMADWDERAAESPLGAAALAGSTFALQPGDAAFELGYSRAFSNSIDAVGSRDLVIEFLYVATQSFVDISRLCEELISWASVQFSWIRLDDAYSTGSSIMPQKKNPDIAELTRGRSGRLIGDLMGLLATMKSQPLAYNRDLIEDKNACFDAVDSAVLSLPALIGMVRTFRVNEDILRAQAISGFSLATEVADYLVRHEVPFSEAHEVSGQLVQYCEAKTMTFDDLTADDLHLVDARLGSDLLESLTVESALAAHSAVGGTAPARVHEQINEARENIARARSRIKPFEIPAVAGWWSGFPRSSESSLVESGNTEKKGHVS